MTHGPEDGCVEQYVPGIGPVCRLPNGLLRLTMPDGGVSYTHGGDPVPPEDPLFDQWLDDHGGKRQPVCAQDPGSDYHHVLIYARAQDDENRYTEIAPQIRDLVLEINGHLDAEARLMGATSADFRFHCTNGQVRVFNEALPTPKANANYMTIMNDLKAKGYNSVRVKHWVWYDDQGACNCAGAANFHSDDRLSLDNKNNGNPGITPMFAITFGYLGSQGHRTMMHEAGHTMGAVQSSAPNASPGAGHCNDGQDILCYDDSGSKPPEYDPNVCPGYERFDCNKDDYFHPHPPTDNYLATHWNLGSQLNRFVVVELEDPVVHDLVCGPSPSNLLQQVECSFHAAVTIEAEVYYEVDWGDGNLTRVPGAGFVPPEATQTALYAWQEEGAYIVTVTVFDDREPPLVSEPVTLQHEVVFEEIPVAVPTVDPQRANPGELFTFDGSASYRPEGSIEAYEWRHGDEVVSTGVVHSMGFQTPGDNCLELTVTDHLGDTDSAVLCVQVNHPPVAVAGVSPELEVIGETVVFDASDSYDPDGVVVAYQWSDDGIVVSDQLVYETGFATSGDHCMGLEVTDDEGATGTTEVCVEVIDPPQPIAVAKASPSLQNLGFMVTFDGSDSDAQDPTGRGISFSWTENGQPVSSQSVFSKSFSSIGEKCLVLTVTNPWDVSHSDTVCVEITDVYDVSATPTQGTFFPTNPAVIDVWVHTVAGQSVHGAGVDIEASYDSTNNAVNSLLGVLPCATSWNDTGTTINGFVRFTAPSTLSRCVGTGPNGDLPTYGQGHWKVEVVGASLGNAGTDSTSYRVGV